MNPLPVQLLLSAPGCTKDFFVSLCKNIFGKAAEIPDASSWKCWLGGSRNEWLLEVDCQKSKENEAVLLPHQTVNVVTAHIAHA